MVEGRKKKETDRDIQRKGNTNEGEKRRDRKKNNRKFLRERPQIKTTKQKITEGKNIIMGAPVHLWG